MQRVRPRPPTLVRPTLICLAILPLLIVLVPRASLGYEVRFNCGGLDYLDTRGHQFVIDPIYTVQNGAGRVGGFNDLPPTWKPIGGTAEPDTALYRRVAFLWNEFRFDVANGDYLVRLHFADIFNHGPDQKIFDLVIEGQTVIDNFDIYELVGDHYATSYTFHVPVTDGQLNVEAPYPPGSLNQLSAIEVWDAVPDAQGPSAPVGLTVWESYGRIMLDWDDNLEEDLDGYHLERSLDSQGPFERLTTDLIHRSRGEDATALPGTTYYYRVLAVDAFGNEGQPTDALPGMIRPDELSQIPIYEITITPGNWWALNFDIDTNEEVPGDFAYQGHPESPWPNVGLRYRGRTSRQLSKKSWKVKFDKYVPGQTFIKGQEEINLNSHFGERTGIREKLAWDVCKATGIPYVKSQHIQLRINGEYYGVYTEDEQIDRRWLDRHGYPPGGSLYKADTLASCMQVLPDSISYVNHYSKQTNQGTGYDDLIAFIELIDATPPEEIWNTLAPIFDIEGFIRYKATMTALGNDSFFCHNYYLYHDLVADYWYYLPWDLDSTFGHLGTFHEGVNETVSILHGEQNPLIDKLQQIPHFRRRFLERTLEILEEDLTSANFDPIIDSTFALVHEDLRLDWHKWGWEDPQYVDGGAAEVKSFIPLRKAHVEFTAVPPRMPAQYIFVNEICADNDGVIQDEFGEYDDWVEIVNVGTATVNLAGHFLTDDIAFSTKWALPDTTLGAGEYILFWCDGDTLQGPTHTNFALEKQGEWVGLYGPLASLNWPVDTQGFGAQIKDVSYGRYPDGSYNWTFMGTPTPMAANLDVGNLPPVITETEHVPSAPGLNEPVTVTALIEDDGGIDSAKVYFTPDTLFVELPMVDDGTNGDVIAGDHVYTAIIPGQPVAGLVHYYIAAWDNLGRSYTDPRDAPLETHVYTVEYQGPELYINEFLAQNLTVLQDEWGEYDDWVEIYNADQDSVPLLGLRLSDDLAVPNKYVFPDTTLGPGEFLIIWCDNDYPLQGPFHANFRLSVDGEQVGLFADDQAGFALIDSVTFGTQTPDVSQGRNPDGGPEWRFWIVPTPGVSNLTGTGVGDDGPAGVVPLSLVLGAGRPNPTFGRMSIPFGLPARGRTTIIVYDVAGRAVARVLDDVLEPGFHQAEWNGRLGLEAGGPAAPAGVYFYRLRWSGESRTGKLTIVR